MKKYVYVLICIFVIACLVPKTSYDIGIADTESSVAHTEFETSDVEIETESQLMVHETDVAFEKPCIYVDEFEDCGALFCVKGIKQDWKYPADGWRSTSVDELTYIYQVYNSEDVLLLPLDYGSNTYRIIGIDGKESDCKPCEGGD